jgi:SAM-dependent methyltransferase
MPKIKREEVHEFWRNPNTDRYGVPEKFKVICRQNYYPPLKPVSDMWVGIFKRFVGPEMSVLELGCSVGRNLYYLDEAGYHNLTGVEINEHAPELSRKSFGDATADRIITSTIEDYLSEPRSFDVVFTSGVLMHIHPDSEWIFAKMAEAAQHFLICSEVEAAETTYRFPRNYRKFFEVLGLRQVHEQIATPQSRQTILRVFTREIE